MTDEHWGTLYLVPTPIGNLDDMTFRAVKVLNEVDLIASEDTRKTKFLLNHFEIMTRQISYHEHNERERSVELINYLKAGKSIAQVSDAGMPSISDPGETLVNQAINAGIKVVPLPGANAALTALIASGLSAENFTFLGFLPRKSKKRVGALDSLKNRTETLIFYESPHRLKETLWDLNQVFGAERSAVLGRELTKKYEEFIRGTLSELLNWSESYEILGEFVILVAGNDSPEVKLAYDPDESVADQVSRIMSEEKIKPKDAIKKVARIRQMKTSDVYNKFHQL